MTALDFIGVGARSRGLSTRLFRRAELEELAGVADLPALVRALARSPKLLEPLPEGASVADVEEAVRHTSARHLATLARWAGERSKALTVFHAEQDRRSLRALLRGAVQGATAEARLHGLLPTPRLPERALKELARQPTPRQVVAQLVLLSHPDAPGLVTLTAVAHPSLFQLEQALLRGYAARALASARLGDDNLRAYVAARLDLGNAQAALLLAGGPRDVDAAGCFVEGGRWLPREAFVAAATAETRARAAEALARSLAATPLAPVFKEKPEDPARVECTALAWALQAQRAAARLDPLCSATLLRFLLALEAQSADLLRLAWGASLGAPASYVRKGLVTPWN